MVSFSFCCRVCPLSSHGDWGHPLREVEPELIEALGTDFLSAPLGLLSELAGVCPQRPVTQEKKVRVAW